MATRKPALENQIPLHAGMKERLERISALTGVPAATLASFAIRRWVAQQERTLALIEGLGDAVGGEMGPRLKECCAQAFLRGSRVWPIAQNSPPMKLAPSLSTRRYRKTPPPDWAALCFNQKKAYARLSV